jgi:GAF domain-containing protein
MLDAFSLKMLRLQRDTPDRFWQLSGAILREALKQVETHPAQTGVEITIAKCMPPRDGKVRSLRLLAGMGTPPWRGDLHTKDYFLGTESLAGHVITMRHGEMIPDTGEKGVQAPVQVVQHERSVAAFPIMRENCIAGVLLVSSTQTNYFMEERMMLIEIFADLIRLAFYDSEFHPITNIDLGLMPPLAFQRTHFANFRQRVESMYRRASRDESASMRELIRVEEQVREQLEEELLAIAGSEKTAII